MSHRPSECSRRPGCGGVLLCAVCLNDGIARADCKLVKGQVALKHLPEMVQSVLPEATENESAIVAQHLLRTGVAVNRAGNNVEHRLWPLLRNMLAAAIKPIDPEEYVCNEGADWALPLITHARLTKAGLHLYAKPRSSKVLVRKHTALNAIDARTLAKTLRAKGVKGTSLEDVFKEYDTAFKDVYKLASEGEVVIDENMAWHSSAVPKATPGALAAWQRALNEYKLLE